MHPAHVAYDALFYASKIRPSKAGGKWSLSAAVGPAGVAAAPLDVPPSVHAALVAFTADEGMRLELPPVESAPAAPAAVAAAWAKALLTCTPAGAAGLHVPISPVEHENAQLRWGRKLPLCAFGAECDGACLVNSPGPLHVYLSVEEQDAHDKTGKVPQGALFCLLCIRRDAQALYLAHRAALGATVSASGRPTFCVPPFQNLVDVPGGYASAAIAVPPEACGDVPVRIVGVASTLTVVTDVHTNTKYVDQGAIVCGASNCRAARA
jgi:hypothetical protein